MSDFVAEPSGAPTLPGLHLAGGDMARLIAAHDWSTSPIGAPSAWPPSLRTTVGFMLPAQAQIVLFWGPDYVALYNDAYVPTIGDKHPRALGRPGRENWTELWDDLEPMLAGVRSTGETFAAKDRPFYIERHGGQGETVWFDVSYSAVPDETGGVGGVLCIVSETTERVRTDHRIRDSEARFHAMADSIDQMVWSTLPDGYHDYYNRRWYDFTGVPEGSTDGEAWNGMFHPDDQQRAWDRWNHSLTTGAPYEIEYRLRHRSGDYRWVLGRAQPMLGADGGIVRWYGTCTDIHDQKMAQARLEESEDRLRLATDATTIGIWDFAPQSGVLRWDDQVRAVFGLKPGAPVSYPVFLAGIHEGDREATDHAVLNALDPAGPGGYHVEYRTIGLDDGIERWVEARGRGIFVDGQCVRFIGTTLDISARKATEQALADGAIAQAEQARLLATLNRTGAALAGELQLERLVQMATDAGVELTGAQFGAFFHNVINEEGESYLLYTLSGAKPSQFDFGMPRATEVFHPTFAGTAVVRSDDITLDPRYGRMGPHFGMPKGHLPVRSYLAVPVIGRSGEVIGGLFFGHSEPGRFDAAHETLMVGVAGQAATAMDNARLFQSAQREIASRMRAERELRELNETLEQRVVEEIEQRSAAEEALRQVQKMETLGQLTGGVAHDFNNLLQIVTGNLGLLQRGLAPDNDKPGDSARMRRAADNAMRGAERAAVLTQRLLAFSRRQPLDPKPVDANRLVSGMSDLLHRTLGETVEIESVLSPGLWAVEVDAHQLENAILNLAVNARDAILAKEPDEGGVGKLTIETNNTHLDRGYSAMNAEVVPGQYVCITVSDTGTGMNEDTAARAFEPFFTTKDVGRGTGLGLSMVYGFVKQSEGHLKIYSEEGEGTSVKIYLPRLVGARPEVDIPQVEYVPEGDHHETILVCEDDDDVRAYTVEVLRELGYKVLESHDGPSALRLLERPDSHIDLLFTDVVLPSGMTGAVLAREAKAMRPDLKILFTTGYARNAIVHHGRLDPGVALITKPFSYAELAARVRDMLDALA